MYKRYNFQITTKREKILLSNSAYIVSDPIVSGDERSIILCAFNGTTDAGNVSSRP